MSRWLIIAAVVTIGVLVTVSLHRPGDAILKLQSEARELDGKTLVVARAVRDRGTITRNVLAVIIGDVQVIKTDSRRMGWILEPDEVDYGRALNARSGQKLRLRYSSVPRPHRSGHINDYLYFE